MDPLAVFTTEANALFRDFVSGGRVRYSGFRGARSRWEPLFSTLEELDLNGRSRSERRAFWINYYNLRAMRQVVEAGSIKSPLDVPGFFDKKRMRVAGQNLTLNEVENRFLRPDPRVHFALVCVAKGCPSIQPRAYTAARVESQLNAATRRALNDANWLKVEGDKVQVSKVFEWYADDFGGADGVVPFINKYRKEPLPEGAALSFYPYDWALNGR